MTKYDENLSRLMVDPRKIQQVYQNLIVNGFQAMPMGGILSITVMQKAGMVEIAFKDIGIGIPIENLPNLFEPLFSTKMSGIGLG